MRFVADLHIHSHFSISTSRELTPGSLEAWARRKGILVVGTGDATHPGWLRELKDCLEPAEEGLFRLKAGAAADGAGSDPAAIAGSSTHPRFLLSAEVSTIYRRGERTRKVHHLILLPGFAAAEALQRRLEPVGSLVSDGRPVLGLDSRHLLEIVLEACPGACFIPAHIWTPWFSALGDKSGFDSIEECYGELSREIYAVETGLSSDPPMNWSCSFLDRFALVSNSDAHSPEKLGREANLFDCELSYPALLQALKQSARGAKAGGGFLGTLEFFPQEGKYHYDGHRKCGVRWEPRQTLEKGGLCPVCGKPVTIGVLHRVAQLADRDMDVEGAAGPQPAGRPAAQARDMDVEGAAGPQPAGRPAAQANRPLDRRPPGRPDFHSLVPLKEILAEIAGTRAQSRQVSRRYDELLARGHTELGLLLELPVPEVARLGGEALAEAVRRMRAGEVRVEPGYDGEYGRVALFDRGEARELCGQALLFGPGESERQGSRQRVGADLQAFRGAQEPRPQAGPAPALPRPSARRLNPEQRRAVEHGEGPALVLAGPGTGKTAVLAARVAHLIRSGGAEPEGIVAVTFTNRAAREMRERLEPLLPDPRLRERIRVGTFHAFGLALLKACGQRLDLNWPFTILNQADREELLASLPACPKGRAAALAEAISLAKQAAEEEPPAEARELLAQYEATLAMHNAVDLDDLLRLPVRFLESQPAVLEEVRSRTSHLLIDEYQDVNAIQYRLVRLLMPAVDAPLFAIGDPDQAIYGFRGADSRFLGRFLEDYPRASVYCLKTSYRCSATILKASSEVLPPAGRSGAKPPLRPAGLPEYRGEHPIPLWRRRATALPPAGLAARLRISEHASEVSEAEYVARTIEGLMGGTRFFSLDSAVSAGEQQSGIRSFAEIAVLCRVARQMDALAKAFRDHAIPYQAAADLPWLQQEPARSILRILQALRAPGSSLARERALRLAPAEDLQRWRRDFEREGDLVGLLASLAAVFPDSEAAQAGLLRLAAETGGGIDDFLEAAVLGTEPDALARGAERVTLLTLHAAKGLEYPCVFITGCEDGLLPYTLPGRRPADPQEERRLFYVGMTRAGAYLYLTHARRRFLFGRELRLPPSPFLAGLGEELAERLRPDPPPPARRRGPEQLDLF
jgi:DNA helicase-2/ATP-dependent DNA helicase PcrA